MTDGPGTLLDSPVHGPVNQSACVSSAGACGMPSIQHWLVACRVSNTVINMHDMQLLWCGADGQHTWGVFLGYQF